MTQTGCYDALEDEEEELEMLQEEYQMIRPSYDYSAATVSKEDHLSWVEETAQEMIERENLPMAVLRPTSIQEPKVMRGITAGIGKDLNSQPDQERIIDGHFDDQTIATGQASTAKLRRESQYAPTATTSGVSKAKQIPLATDSPSIMAEDDLSTVYSDVYRPVQRPSTFMDNNSWDEPEPVEETTVQVNQNRWMYNGVYFPCFGLLVPPLFGSDIFPLPPKQEKYHFNLMMDRPTGHYDGNPNSKYEDEIRRFMKTYLNSFRGTSLSFNTFDGLDEGLSKWAAKFPFASVRWGQTAQAAESTVRGKTFEPVELNPRLMEGARDRLPHITGKNQISTTGAAHHQPVQPFRSKEILINRQQKQDVQKLKDFLGNSDLGQSSIKTQYDQFTKVVENFRKNGGKFKPPRAVIRKTINAIRDIKGVDDMQVWLMENQSKSQEFHAYHDEWANGPLLKQYYTTTHRIKLSSYMLTCLTYDHFLNFRKQVIFVTKMIIKINVSF